MKNFDLAAAANISSNPMKIILEKLDNFRDSNEFALINETHNTQEYQINHKGLLVGRVVITFKNIQNKSKEISSIQFLNNKGKSLLLNEFTSAIRVFSADFFKYTYSSKFDRVRLKAINGWVTLATIFHEFGHAFDEVKRAEIISREKYQVLNAIEAGSLDFILKLDPSERLAALKKQYKYAIEEHDTSVLDEEVLARFKVDDLSQILENERNASDYSIQRIGELLTFLGIEDEELIALIIDYFSYALGSYMKKLREDYLGLQAFEFLEARKAA